MSSQFIELDGIFFVQTLLEKSTENQLDQNIRTNFPKTKRRHNIVNTVHVDNVEYIPYVGMKMLHVRSQTGEHRQAIQFNGVTFTLPSDESSVFVENGGSEYHFKPIDLTLSLVRVRCSCLDFRFRFAAHNSQDQSLVGQPPPRYVPKTNRPPVNPSRVPGLCKHLLRVVDDMEQEGLLVR